MNQVNIKVITTFIIIIRDEVSFNQCWTKKMWIKDKINWKNPLLKLI